MSYFFHENDEENRKLANFTNTYPIPTKQTWINDHHSNPNDYRPKLIINKP